MKTITDEQLKLLDAGQRAFYNECISKEWDFNVIGIHQDNTLEFIHVDSIDQLYSLMFSNLRTRVYKKYIPCKNDNRLMSADRSELAIDICITLIDLEVDKINRYINVLQLVHTALEKYDDYVIQYFIRSKWTGQSEYHSCRDLNEFIEVLKEESYKVVMVNDLIQKACEYVIDNDLDLNSFLSNEFKN